MEVILRGWDKDMQDVLTFKDNVVFATPKWYVEKSKHIDNIKWCLEKNLDDTSAFNKIHTLRYILNIYVVKRKGALEIGISEIESSDCCKEIMNWIEKEIGELEKIELKINSKANKSKEIDQNSDELSTAKINKLERYRIYVETYNHFTRVEKLSDKEADKKTCEKHGINSKTLERAIKII